MMPAFANETPHQAARRFAASIIQRGYQPTALYEYRDRSGNTHMYRARCDHPDSAKNPKWMRPLHHNGTEFVLGEPSPPAEGKLLYRLPELIESDGLVFVVEGEKAADALARLDLVVTTSGGAESANAADFSALAGRTVRVWPDNDDAGARYAASVLKRLREVGCVASVVDIAAIAGLPPKGDAFDWIALNPHATAEDVVALPLTPSGEEESPESPESPPAPFHPEPLRRQTPRPSPYPMDALGPILAPVAERLHAVMRAPKEICGQSVLAAASLAVQGHADVEIDGRVYPLSIWALTIAESGERKSAVDSYALRAHREYERELAEQYKSDSVEYGIRMAAHKAASAAAEKGKTESAIRDALRGLSDAPEAPLLPHLLCTDPTYEGLVKLALIGRPSLGLFSDEGGMLFGGSGMAKESVSKTAAGFSKLYDNGTADRVRAGDGASKLYGRRLALHLLAQPVIAEAVFSNPVLAGQGFLARCLIAWPESTAGTRTYVEENLNDDAAMRIYWHRIQGLQQTPLPTRAGTRQELEPRRLHLDPDAKALWILLYNTIEAEAAPNGAYCAIRPWASKAPEQILRLAGVLTLIADADARSIDRTSIKSAADLVNFSLNEATRLAGTAELSPEVKRAEALLNWCHEGQRRLVYSTDLLQNGPRCIRERQQLADVMETLESAGWAKFIDGGMVLDGRHRRHVWSIAGAGNE